ncbi:class I SAM-dependent methyltransferase [Longispora sp. NPDC051575]|uniref:class I SAM-dependent methyltransferase n=1 Tax=Longispora sp. NPDC051575 TaxID=3154943 RepID=UPI003417B289
MTAPSYDKVAARYLNEVGDELAGKPLDRGLLLALLELAGPGPVADLGAGPGHVADFLRGHGADVFGLDLSQGMCATGAGRYALPMVAGDLTRLPLRSGSLSALTALYTVIHLYAEDRARAYGEFARVLRPGGYALVAFHVSDAEHLAGEALTMDSWWGESVDLTFRFLDPAAEQGGMSRAGLEIVSTVERTPLDPAEHQSNRAYLLARRPVTA